MTIPTKVTKEMVEALDAFFSDDAVTYYSEADAFALTALARRVIEPDEETVERCARALCASQGWPWLNETEADGRGDFSGADYCDHARAVLAALGD